MASCAPDDTQCLVAEAVVRQAADQAVAKTFAILGVDIDSPREVEEFRKDLRFGQTMRKAADKGLFAMVTAVAGGVIFALWAGLRTKVGGP